MHDVRPHMVITRYIVRMEIVHPVPDPAPSTTTEWAMFKRQHYRDLVFNFISINGI